MSATVRYRTIANDSPTGMTSSGANHVGLVNTKASSPSAKNPTAKWAIGEIRMTTGLVAERGFTGSILALARERTGRLSPLVDRNLTFDQYGSYRQVLCTPPDCS